MCAGIHKGGDSASLDFADGRLSRRDGVCSRRGTTTSGSRPIPNGLWNAVLDVGASYTRTFDTPGIFSYFCVIHIGQNARVTVNP